VVIFDDKSTGMNFNPRAKTIFGDITIKEDLELIDVKVYNILN
jgi:hypothetical protein